MLAAKAIKFGDIRQLKPILDYCRMEKGLGYCKPRCKGKQKESEPEGIGRGSRSGTEMLSRLGGHRKS